MSYPELYAHSSAHGGALCLSFLLALASRSFPVANNQALVEEEIHVAGAQLSASARDENIVNDDPNVLRDERVEDKHSISGTDAPGVDAWCEGESNSLPRARGKLFVHN
jgi:hypothetical protein